MEESIIYAYQQKLYLSSIQNLKEGDNFARICLKKNIHSVTGGPGCTGVKNVLKPTGACGER
jgi:hypothetical protein